MLFTHCSTCPLAYFEFSSKRGYQFGRSLNVPSSSPPVQEAEEEDAESPTPKPESVCGAAKPHVG